MAHDGNPKSFFERARATLESALGRTEENAASDEPDPASSAVRARPARPRSSLFGDPDLPLQIYGRRSCFWSTRAVAIAKMAGLEHSYVEIGGYEGVGLLQSLRQETGHYTVPMVFVRGRFIGGCDELEELYRSGRLAKLVAETPA